MAGRRELTHIGADLGQQSTSINAAQTRNLHPGLHHRLKRAHLFTNLFVQPGDLTLDEFECLQPLPQQKPMMTADPALQRQPQLRNLIAQRPARQFCQLGGIRLAFAAACPEADLFRVLILQGP